MNNLKTTFFLGLLTGLVMLIGYGLGGQTGLVMALLFSAVMNFGAYWFSDRIVLSTYGAKVVERSEQPELYRIVEKLCLKAKLPMPKVAMVPTEMPNAFATGRNENHAVVAVTKGLMTLLDEQELEGVLAHELAHIKNKDMLISSMAATIAGAISYLVQMAYFANMFSSSDEEEGGGILASLMMLILAPIIATLLHMAISRSREYLADAEGARISGNPNGLARALKKLGDYSASHKVRVTPRQETAAHLFIVNPFKGSMLMALFSTHPPMEERVARLQKLV